MAEQQQDRDQRTEQATPTRIRKAREEGQIGFSAELVSGVLLTCGVLFFWIFGFDFFSTLCETMAFRLTYFEPMLVDPRLLVKAMITDSQAIGLACLALILPVAIAASLSGLLQTNFNISFKPLNLDWDKLSVTKGFGRIFSGKSAVRGVFSIIKAALIVCIIYFVAKSRLDDIALSGFGSFRGLMFAMCEILLYAAGTMAAMMLVVGMLDLAYQKWKHLEDLKMSVRDIKDENKQNEGDPLMRARIKRLQAEMGRARMLAAVPEADAIITNPTHFAVAIRYDRNSMDAPMVTAKGADFLAKKIIEIAKQNNVPVVERKPVARFLYFNVKVGNQIPFELYQAVAEVLNFVNRLRAGI